NALQRHAGIKSNVFPEEFTSKIQLQNRGIVFPGNNSIDLNVAFVKLMDSGNKGNTVIIFLPLIEAA
ncbi:MAG: hypothetical protein ACK4IY_08200, partial [Chitinophagales bacterium]